MVGRWSQEGGGVRIMTWCQDGGILRGWWSGARMVVLCDEGGVMS